MKCALDSKRSVEEGTQLKQQGVTDDRVGTTGMRPKVLFRGSMERQRPIRFRFIKAVVAQNCAVLDFHGPGTLWLSITAADWWGGSAQRLAAPGKNFRGDAAISAWLSAADLNEN